MNYELISVWSQGLSALLFLAVLIFVWTKYIQPAVVSAQENANAKILEAERRRDEAEAEVVALQGEIVNAQADAKAIKERSVAHAKSESEIALAEAREQGERALRNAKGELDRARAAARATYRDELLDRALDLARVQASAKVDESLNSKIVTGFLSSLERGANN